MVDRKHQYSLPLMGDQALSHVAFAVFIDKTLGSYQYNYSVRAYI